MAWVENGPVSLPPRPLPYVVAGALLVAACISGALSFHSTLREGGTPLLGGSGHAHGVDQAVMAQPIVVQNVTPPAPAPKAAANTLAEQTDKADETNSVAAQTAAAQQAQTKPSTAGNIDDVLTSSSEKPQAPAKSTTDEAPPPGSPDTAKSEVPF